MLATPIPIAPHPHRHSKEAEQPIALSVEGLNVAYSAGVALEDVGFTVRRGEYVAIIGPNGAGKSTLLKAILGMITPQSGSVRVESEEPLGKRQIGELSGGQRRRAFIARALAQEADMLLLDEPMSGVDVDGQAAIMTVLDTLNADGLTILMTTHDLDLAFRRFGKVMALKRRLVAFGVPDEVYTPDALEQVYDRVLMTRTGGGRMTMLIDEHGCGDC
jgi:ABC-type Mn2+/Zn2+ transport system ATPase subunit